MNVPNEPDYAAIRAEMRRAFEHLSRGERGRSCIAPLRALLVAAGPLDGANRAALITLLGGAISSRMMGTALDLLEGVKEGGV